MQAENLQIGLLVATMVLNAAFFYRYFRPWLARTLRESKRVADLLSELPAEVNVERLVLETVLGLQPTTAAAIGA